MFVAVGSDWTTAILNMPGAWCDGVYGMVRGTGNRARVTHIHGSLEGLFAWLARTYVEGKIPRAAWSAFHVDAKTLRLRVLCKAVGKRIVSGKAPLLPGQLRAVLHYELEMLGSKG